jgi:hypothetical protein
MVERKLNVPICKIHGLPVFWLSTVGTKWYCNSCSSLQIPNTTCFEFTGRYAAKGVKIPKPAQKLFVCLDCARKYLEEALYAVDMSKKGTLEGYKMVMKL